MEASQVLDVGELSSPNDESPTEFHVEIVRVGEVTKHPNADTLSITKIHGGYPVLFKTGEFQEGDTAIYVPVDSLVPVSRPEFAWLAKGGAAYHRVRAVRLRGIFSMGLLVPITDNYIDDFCVVGDDVQKELGVLKYDPPRKGVPQLQGVAKAQRNPGFMPVYGIEAYRRWSNVLQEGEAVAITEKIHGCNARYCYHGGRLYVGSHRSMRGVSRSRLGDLWWAAKHHVLRFFGRKDKPGVTQITSDVWWEIAETYGLKELLAKHPDMVVYGEIFGTGIQDLDYGEKGHMFRIFDVLDVKAGRYLDADDLSNFADVTGLIEVPHIYRGPWHPELLSLAEGRSKHYGAGHLREGFVVRAVPERRAACGRVILKVISEGYLLRKEG